MNKISTKIMCVFLTIATLLVSLPLTVLATQVNETQTVIPEEDVPEQLNYEELVEEGYVERIYDEEDLYSYLFGKADGTKTKIYYQYPIKYVDENGNIKDKSLKLVPQTVNGITSFASKASDIDVVFHNALSGGVEVSYQDISVTMIPELSTVSLSEISGNLSLDEESVRYNLDQSTYIEYSLTYMGIKEDIVVTEYTGQTEYSFVLGTGGLSTALLENGEYVLIDNAGNIKASLGDVLIFTADERNNTFGEMRVEPIITNQLYRLTICLNSEWLSDTDTVYPITIDPSISITSTDTTNGSIEDAIIGSSTTYNTSLSSLYVGRGSSGATIRTLMRFPNLDLSGKIVTSARVELRDIMCQSESTKIDCHEYTGNTWSNSSAPTWSNVGANYIGKLLDSRYVFYGNGNVNGSINRYSFDITELAKDWAAGTADPEKGVLFKAESAFENGTTNTFKTFASINRSSYQPSFYVTYIEPVGVNSGYEYDTQSISDNITILNNVQYGNIVTQYQFITPQGLLPIAPAYVFNSLYYTSEFFDKYSLDSSSYGKFGNGWKLNLIELIQSQNNQYLYVDGNGTEYYLIYDSESGKYLLDDIGAMLSVNTDGTFTLELEDEIIRTFSSNGLISSILYQDKTYIYEYTNNLLTKITCNSDTILQFVYDGLYLESITYFSALDNSSITSSIVVDTAGNVCRIDDIYGNSTNISVSSTQINIYNSIDGFGMKYTLSNDKATQYRNYRKTSTSEYVISTTSITRSNNRIAYTTDEVVTTYLLDAYDRLFNVITSTADFETIYDAQMYVYDESQGWQSHVNGDSRNILHNTFSGFENWGAGEFICNSSESIIGNESAMLSTTNGTTKYMSQTVSLSPGSYVLSAYVKYEDLVIVNSQIAGGLNFKITNSSNVLVSVSEYYVESLGEDGEWCRIWIPCTITTSGNYTATISLTNANGTVYVDCIQLEQGTTPTAFNMIVGGDFETSEDDWYDMGYAGDHMFGSDCADATYAPYQRIDLYAMNNDRSFILAGWAYLPQETEDTFSVSLTFYAGEYINFDFPMENIAGYQYFCYEVTVPEEYTQLQYVDVGINYHSENAYSNGYFDNLLLTFGNQVDSSEEEAVVSTGLDIRSSGDGTCALYGIGVCTDTDLVIPAYDDNGDKLIQIVSNAFGGSNITSVTIPDTVTHIRYSAFENCTSLTDVYLGSGLVELEREVFKGCSSLESIDLPDSLTTIGPYCFQGCTSLVSAYIPDSVTTIGTYLFYNCSSLQDVSLGNGITSIRTKMFQGCASLESLVIPDGVTTIGEDAFKNCTKLKSLQLPKTLTTIETTAFSGCSSTVKFYYNDTLDAWSSVSVASGAMPSNCDVVYNSELVGDFVYTYTYNEKGAVIATEVRYIGVAEGATNTTAVMFTSVTYDSYGNMLTYTDESGHTTTYTYDRYGNVLTVTDASGVVTTYSYYSNGLLKSVSRSGKTNTYTYTNGLLTGVTHTGSGYTQSYTYTYNNYGNLTSVAVGSQTLVTYAYTDNGVGDLSSITYANGDVKSYAYDVFGNITEIRMNGTLQATYLYDSAGNLYEVYEAVNGETTRYLEDIYGYVGVGVTFDSDGYQIESIPENSVEIGSTTTEDIYDRLVSESITANDVTVYTKSYTYAVNGYYSSYEVAGERFSNSASEEDNRFEYTYNDLGYLTSVKEGGILKLSYTYDNLGQVVREDNDYSHKTYVYTYDNGGNILTKKTYAYTTGTLGTAESTVSYGYTNSNWKDQLTSYNGTAISYDASGNPLNWRNGYTLSWTGRQLDQLNIGNVQYTYKYNADGLRVSKSNGTDTYTYRWDGATLLSQDHNGTTVLFLYNDGELIGFNYNGNNYYYGIDNLGVIHYIYNESGEIVVTYTYDAWGNTISVTGNSTLISVNPIRYKSYYYDNETGFYYLQSRYYDPTVGRFINSDEVEYLCSSDSVLSCNLLAYCENNPINSIDTYGNRLVIIKNLGYYETSTMFFYYSINAPQRDFGYCDAYDRAAWLLGIDIAWLTVYFTYESKEWRIEFWKGTYGKLYAFDVSTGCEIGVYYRKWYYVPGWYQSADNSNTLKMEMSLKFKGSGKELFKRKSTEKDNYFGRHWWLTGFKVGIQSSPKKLTMTCSITFKNSAMANRFAKALRKASGNKGTGKAKSIRIVNNKTVKFVW